MIFFAVCALALLACWGAPRLWGILGAGAGYKAKILGSAIFVSGRDPDLQDAPEISSEAYRILRLFRAVVDREGKTVTASCLGLNARTAVYREGYGTALTRRGIPSPPTPPTPAPRDESDGGELEREPAPAAVARVVEDAFGEADPAKPRRTRAIVVLRDGKIVAERYAAGITPQMALPGWSMGKSVLNALVGAAVLRGALRLDQDRLLPEWSSDADPRGKIRLEDLLRMRSGLRWAEAYEDPLSDVVQMLFALPDAAGYAASKPLRAAPGASWQYSSGTTNILSGVLRRALGEAEYAVFPRRALFEPLGMKSAVFETDASGTFIGSSFVYASARDWARFGLLFLNDGVWRGRRLLPEGWVAFSTTPTPQSPEGRYGAHWWLRLSEEFGAKTEAGARLPKDAYHAMGHEGQVLTVIPSRRLVVVRLGLSIRVDAWNHAEFLDRLLEALP